MSVFNDPIAILPEESVSEYDSHGVGMHEYLPPLDERVHYFPRLDKDYESMFVPKLPGMSVYRDSFCVYIVICA